MAKTASFLLISILLSHLLVFTLFQPLPCFATEEPQNVILLGWDGVQRNHLYELLYQNELPNIMALINEGTIVNITITLF